MKSSDLKVGTDYAAEERWGGVYRVTVLEVGATTTVEDRRAFGNRKVQKTGLVKVKCVNDTYPGVKGEVRYLEPRYLKKTWKQHHAERVQAGKYAAQREREEQATRKQRAETAFRLHTVLVEAGAKVGLSYTYDDEDYEALKAAGFQPATEVDFGSRSHFHSAVNGLSDLMREGKVSLEYVGHLLGMVGAPEPEDSLDQYDLDDEEA